MFDPIDIHVGNRIRVQRIAKSMSQKELGQKLGVTFQQIQKYEKGTNRIGAGRLFRIAQILDVSVAHFFSDISSSPQSLISRISEPPAANIGDWLQSRYRNEAKDLLRAFDQITDPKTRSQIVELVRTLSTSIKKND